MQLINLVKVQSKIQTKLLGQKDAKITLSHKGKKKSSEVLLHELRSVIKQYECTLTETIDLNLVDVSIASFPGHSPRRVAWYSLFAHARNIPGIYGIRKIPNVYRTLRPCTNRVCSFHEVD